MAAAAAAFEVESKAREVAWNDKYDALKSRLTALETEAKSMRNDFSAVQSNFNTVCVQIEEVLLHCQGVSSEIFRLDNIINDFELTITEGEAKTIIERKIVERVYTKKYPTGNWKSDLHDPTKLSGSIITVDTRDLKTCRDAQPDEGFELEVVRSPLKRVFRKMNNSRDGRAHARITKLVSPAAKQVVNKVQQSLQEKVAECSFTSPNGRKRKALYQQAIEELPEVTCETKQELLAHHKWKRESEQTSFQDDLEKEWQETQKTRFTSTRKGFSDIVHKQKRR